MIGRQEETIDLVKIIQSYMDGILEEVTGLKALIMDSDTLGIVSLVMSKTHTIREEVFLMEHISNIGKEPLTHLKGIYLLRPTMENKERLMEHLEEGIFSEFYIYFTNLIPEALIQELASVDKHCLVKQCQEIFADFQALDSSLFSLGIRSTISLCLPPERWQSSDKYMIERMREGLLSTLLGTRQYPLIRYQASSPLCFALGDAVSNGIRDHNEFFQKVCKHDETSVLLLLDRKEDPVTPLLNQWTYQAMLHEIIGIDQNKVSIKKDLKQLDVVLDPNYDEFYKSNMYSNYGDLAANLKILLDDFQKTRANSAKVETIEEMQKFVENYAEFRQYSGNVSKHVNIMTELSKTVEKLNLYQISELEQDIAVTENRNEHFRNEGIAKLEKLRLVLLYVLRYEKDDRIFTLKNLLRDSGLQPSQVKLVDTLLYMAGTQARRADIFAKRVGLFEKAKKAFKKSFKDVKNIYIQHQSWLSNILDQLTKGKLKEADYPSTMPFSPKNKIRTVIVFFIGGVTYQEAREVALLNQTGLNIIVGGTNIQNYKNFLADLTLLTKLKTPGTMSLEIDDTYGDIRNPKFK